MPRGKGHKRLRGLKQRVWENAHEASTATRARLQAAADLRCRLQELEHVRSNLPPGPEAEWRAAHGRMWANDPALEGIKLDREAAAEVQSAGVDVSAFNASRLQLNCEYVMSHVSVLGVLNEI